MQPHGPFPWSCSPTAPFPGHAVPFFKQCRSYFVEPLKISRMITHTIQSAHLDVYNVNKRKRNHSLSARHHRLKTDKVTLPGSTLPTFSLLRSLESGGKARARHQWTNSSKQAYCWYMTHPSLAQSILWLMYTSTYLNLAKKGMARRR